MPKVFVSHSSNDSEFVESEIISLLKRHGIDHWYSKDSICGGDEWVQNISGALRECDWFLVVLSPRSASAKYVRFEVTWAVDNLDPGKIVPVLYEPCAPDKLHFALPSLQFIDFSGATDRHRSRVALLRRWGVNYEETAAEPELPETRSTPKPPKRREPTKRRVRLPKVIAAGCLLGASVLGVAGTKYILRLNNSFVTPSYARVETENRLLLATLPGLQGNWWYEDAPWLAPCFRAELLAAPPGTYTKPIDAWGPRPEEVYARLKSLLEERLANPTAESSGEGTNRWRWLLQDDGAVDDEHLGALQERLSAPAESATFRAHDWHTLAVIRHHLAEKDATMDQATQDAYKTAIGKYESDKNRALLALCRGDFARYLINSHRNLADLAKTQLHMAAEQVHRSGLGRSPQARPFLASLMLCKAAANEALFEWETEAESLAEARTHLEALGKRPGPHPMQASILERLAWMNMWMWRMDAAGAQFAEAVKLRKSLGGGSLLNYLERLHDLHGEAMILRFRGFTEQAQNSLRAIIKEIDDGATRPEIKGDPSAPRELAKRKFNSLERLADCDLFDGRPDLAAKSLKAALSYGREKALFQRGERSDEVRLLCKYALAHEMAGDYKNAERHLAQAADVLALVPGGGQPTASSPKVSVDPKAVLYHKVGSAVTRFRLESPEKARDDLRELLKVGESPLDRDSLELLMMAASRLIESDRAEPQGREDADEDADLLLGLINTIDPSSRAHLRDYLGRYYDAALTAKLGEAPGEVVEDGLMQYAVAACDAAGDSVPRDANFLLLIFGDHKGHAILALAGERPRHFPLKGGTVELEQSHRDRTLPPELLDALAGKSALVLCNPSVIPLGDSLPFDLPETVKLVSKSGPRKK